MTNHKYKVGQRVTFTGPIRNNSPSGVYEILKLLPTDADRIQYRIKSPHEAHERVIGEEHLAVRADAGNVS